MVYIVDRIEQQDVICQSLDGKWFHFKLEEFAYPVAESDCVVKAEEGFVKDENMQNEREEEMNNLIEELFE